MDWDEAGVLRLEISQNKIHHIQAASFSIPLQYSMNRFCVCMHFNFEMGLKLQEHWISSQNPAAPQSISSVTSPPNSTLRRFPSYLLLTLLLYFLFIFTFVGTPYQIFLKYLFRLPCHFLIVVIEHRYNNLNINVLPSTYSCLSFIHKEMVFNFIILK